MRTEELEKYLFKYTKKEMTLVEITRRSWQRLFNEMVTCEVERFDDLPHDEQWMTSGGRFTFRYPTKGDIEHTIMFWECISNRYYLVLYEDRRCYL